MQNLLKLIQSLPKRLVNNLDPKVVTIHNLSRKSEQQVFDFIAKHLLTQGQKAIDYADHCCYRVAGLSCAAGCLIPDYSYDPDYEGLTWRALTYTKGLPNQHLRLIIELQYVHDSKEVNNWPEGLRKVALDFKLSSSVVDEWKPNA